VPSAPTSEIPHTLHVYSGYPGYVCDTGGPPNTLLSAGQVSSSDAPETHGLSMTVGVQLSPAGMYSHPMTGVAAHSPQPRFGVTVVEVPVVELSVVLVAVVEVSDTDIVVPLLLAVADESVVEDWLDAVVTDILSVVSEVRDRESEEVEVAVVEVRVEVMDSVELTVVVVRVDVVPEDVVPEDVVPVMVVRVVVVRVEEVVSVNVDVPVVLVKVMV